MPISASARSVTVGQVAAVEAALEHEVLPAGGQVVGPSELADVADPLADLLRLAGHVAAGHHGRAAVDGQQGGEHPQRRRLAGAVGTEEAEDLAPGHLDAHAPDGVHAAPGGAERLLQVVGGDDAVHARAPPVVSSVTCRCRRRIPSPNGGGFQMGSAAGAVDLVPPVEALERAVVDVSGQLADVVELGLAQHRAELLLDPEQPGQALLLDELA